MLVANGVARVLASDAAGLALERGREEHRLALGGTLGDDAVDGRAGSPCRACGRPRRRTRKRTAREREDPPLQQVLEPAGRGHDDVGLRGLASLLGDADAAVDGGDLERAGMGDGSRLLHDLARELAGGGEHERRGTGAVRGDAVGQRDREGERLARARGGLRQHVAAGEDVADHEALDCEGLGRCRGARGRCVTASDTPRSANDCVDMRNSLRRVRAANDSGGYG